MRVVAYLGDGRVGLEERPDPRPLDGEMVLRVRICGLCGTDLFKLDSDSIAVGTVLGHEIVGEVETSLATDATGRPFVPGERVAVPHHVSCGSCVYCRKGSETMCRTFKENLLLPGGFSDRVLVRSRAAPFAAIRIPETVSDEAASFYEPAACVLRGILRARIEDDDRVVILGAGSMGLLHLLVLRTRNPASDVTVVDPLPERRELAMRLGANRAVSPADAVEAVLASDGAGVDAVFDTVGGESALDAALDSSRDGARVVLFAHAKPGEVSSVDWNRVFKSEKEIIATYSGASGEQASIARWILSGALDASPLVTSRLPFSRFDEAVSGLRERRDLKVLLVPDDSSYPDVESREP